MFYAPGAGAGVWVDGCVEFVPTSVLAAWLRPSHFCLLWAVVDLWICGLDCEQKALDTETRVCVLKVTLPSRGGPVSIACQSPELKLQGFRKKQIRQRFSEKEKGQRKAAAQLCRTQNSQESVIVLLENRRPLPRSGPHVIHAVVRHSSS